jgi:hypothetical protein
VPRTTDSQLKTLRFAPTLTGFFELGGKTFDWDVGALWNRNESIKSNRGDMSLIAARQALGRRSSTPAALPAAAPRPSRSWATAAVEPAAAVRR